MKPFPVEIKFKSFYQEKSRSAVNDEALRTWLESYGLRNKVRFAPGEDLKNSIDSPEVYYLPLY